MKRWLAFLLVLFFFGCERPAAVYDESVTMHAMMLSDLHFTVSPEVVSSIIPAMPYSPEFTKAVFAEITDAHPDVLIITGDNTNSGAKEDMKGLLALLETVKEARIPVLMIPGNHDFNLCEPDKYDAVYTPVLAIGERDPASLSYRTDLCGVRFLAMDDSSADPGMNGFYSKETIAWTKRQLNEAKSLGMRVIFLTHHPLLYGSEPDKGTGRAEMAALLKQYDARLIISGHMHSEAVLQEENLHEIILGMPLSGMHEIGILDLENGWLRYHTKPAALSAYGSENLAAKISEADRLYETRLCEAVETILEKERVTGTEREEILRLFRKFMQDFSAGRLRETAEEIRNDPYCGRMTEVLRDYNYGPWIESALANPPESGRSLEFAW